jgi:hypothetical protein
MPPTLVLVFVQMMIRDIASGAFVLMKNACRGTAKQQNGEKMYYLNLKSEKTLRLEMNNV